MTDQTDENGKNDKLHTLAQALMPYLLDGLKNAGWMGESNSKPHTTKSATPLNHSLYLPELDMFIHAGVLNGDFRRCGFSRTGKLNMEAVPRGVSPVGLCVEGSNNDALQYYIVPCPSLKKWVNVPYDVKYTWDYRVYKESYSRYMAGVIDAARDNAPAKNNLRVRDIGWRDSNGLTPLPQAIINNTRDVTVGVSVGVKDYSSFIDFHVPEGGSTIDGFYPQGRPVIEGE